MVAPSKCSNLLSEALKLASVAGNWKPDSWDKVTGGDWFSRLDKDGSGALSREEFAQARLKALLRKKHNETCPEAQQSGLVPSMGGSPYASMLRASIWQDGFCHLMRAPTVQIFA